MPISNKSGYIIIPIFNIWNQLQNEWPATVLAPLVLCELKTSPHSRQELRRGVRNYTFSDVAFVIVVTKQDFKF